MRVIIRSRAVTRLHELARAVKRRQWNLMKALLSTTRYGLTHGLCSTCSLNKGLSVDKDCVKCRTNQLIRNLFS